MCMTHTLTPSITSDEFPEVPRTVPDRSTHFKNLRALTEDEGRVETHQRNTTEKDEIARLQHTLRRDPDRPPNQSIRMRPPDHRSQVSSAPEGDIAVGATAAGLGTVAALNGVGAVTANIVGGATAVTNAVAVGIPLATGYLGYRLGKRSGHPIAGAAIGAGLGSIAALPVAALIGSGVTGSAAAVGAGILGLGSAASAIVPIAIGAGGYLIYRGLRGAFMKKHT